MLLCVGGASAAWAQPQIAFRLVQHSACTCTVGTQVADCGTGGVCTNGLCTAGDVSKVKCVNSGSCNAGNSRTCNPTQIINVPLGGLVDLDGTVYSTYPNAGAVTIGPGPLMGLFGPCLAGNTATQTQMCGSGFGFNGANADASSATTFLMHHGAGLAPTATGDFGRNDTNSRLVIGNGSTTDSFAPVGTDLSYLLLAGMSGTANNPILSTSTDGTITGSSHSGNGLYLKSTTSGTKGSLFLDDTISLWPDIPANVASQTALLAFSATQSTNVNYSAVGNVPSAFFHHPTLTFTGTLTGYNLLFDQGTYNFNTGAVIAGFNGLYFSSDVKLNDSGVVVGSLAAINAVPTFESGNFTLSTSNVSGLGFAPAIKATGSSAAFTVPTVAAVNNTGAILDAVTSGGTVTVTNLNGLKWADISTLGSGTNTVTNQVVVDIPSDVTHGATLIAAMRSAITSGSGKYFLDDTGGAQSAFAGKFTKYNNFTLAGDGIPGIVASVDSLTNGANIAQTTAYAVPASGAGVYRVCGYVIVSRAATTSSTMPKLQINWTDNDGGTIGATDLTATSTGNATTTFSQACMIVNAKASTNIQYQTTGFLSSGGTSMQYAAHVRVEML
jgi:hypothetical protein